MNQTILLSGATGYIGSKLAKDLCKKSYKVVAIVRKSSSLAHLSEVKNLVKIYNTENLEKVFQDNKIDLIIHLAASTHEENIEEMVQANLKIGINILNFALKYEVKRFINTSTYWQFDEKGEYLPNSLYASMKRAFEDILDYYAWMHNFSIISLRLYDVYGEDDFRSKFLTQLKHNKLPIFPSTKGEQLISMVHIEDVLKAYELAAAMTDTEHVKSKHLKYSVAGNKVSLKNVGELYLKLFDNKFTIDWGKLPYRKNQIFDPFIGEILPNWHPLISLEEGLKKVAKQV